MAATWKPGKQLKNGSKWENHHSRGSRGYSILALSSILQGGAEEIASTHFKHKNILTKKKKRQRNFKVSPFSSSVLICLRFGFFFLFFKDNEGLPTY